MKPSPSYKYFKTKMSTLKVPNAIPIRDTTIRALTRLYNRIPRVKVPPQNIKTATLPPKPALYSSIPKPIQTAIRNSALTHKYYSFTIPRHPKFVITVWFIYDAKTIGNIVPYFERAVSTFLFLAGFMNGININKTLQAYIYLTDHHKTVPTGGEPLCEVHANTAFTTFCQKNTELIIFRNEEWYKVLAHECIHNLCLDFASSPQGAIKTALKGVFKIKSDYLLFETYTEAWANIINILFSIDNMAEFPAVFQQEYKFSLIQCQKVFNIATDYRGTYADMVNGNMAVLRTYKENANCFCYYVLKSVLMHNIDAFLALSDGVPSMNTTPENIGAFVKIFTTKYRDPAYVQNVAEAGKWLWKLKNDEKNRVILNTMRLTIV